MMKHVQTRPKAAFSDDSSLGMDDELSSSEEHICKRPPHHHDDSSESNMSDSPVPTRTETVGCNISNPRDSIFSHFLPDQLDLEEKWLYTLAPRASYDDDSLSSSSDETRRVRTTAQINRFGVNRNTSLDDSTDGSECHIPTSGGGPKQPGNRIGKYGDFYKTDTNNNKEENNMKKDSSVKKREKIRYVDGEISTESPSLSLRNERVSSNNSDNTTSPEDKRNEKGKKNENDNNKKGSKFFDKLKGNKSEKKTSENKCVMNVIKESPLESPKMTKQKKSKEDGTPSPKEKSKLAKYTDKLKSSSFRASPLTKKKNEDKLEKNKPNKKENGNHDRDKVKEKNEKKSEAKSENMTPKTEKKHKSLLSSFRKSHEKLDNDINSLTPSTRPKSLILGRKFPHSIFGGSKENIHSTKNTEKFKSAENLNSKKSIFHFKTFKSKSVEKIGSPRQVRTSCSRESIKEVQNEVDTLQIPSDLTIPESPLETDDDVKLRVFFESNENVSADVSSLQRSHSFGPSTSSKNERRKLYSQNTSTRDSHDDIVENDVTENENFLNPNNRPKTKKVIVKCRRSKSFNNATDHRLKRYDCDIFHEKILPTSSTKSLNIPSTNVASQSCENVKLRCIFYRDYESVKPSGGSGGSVQRSKSFGGRTNNKNAKNECSNQLSSLMARFQTESPKSLRGQPLTDTPSPIPILIHRPSDENLKYRIRETTVDNSASTTNNDTSPTIINNDDEDDIKHNLEYENIDEQKLNMALIVNVDLDTLSCSDIEKVDEFENDSSSSLHLNELLLGVEWNALQLKNNERLLLTNEQRLSIISELLRKIDENTNIVGENKSNTLPQVCVERVNTDDILSCSNMNADSRSSKDGLNALSGDLTAAQTPPPLNVSDNAKKNTSKINGEHRHNMNANDLLAKLNMEILRSISYIKYKPSDKSKKQVNGCPGNNEIYESQIGTDFVQIGCTNSKAAPMGSTNRKAASSLKTASNEEILEKELQIIEELFQNIDTKQLLTELNLNDPNINIPKSALLSLKDKLTYNELEPDILAEKSCGKRVSTHGDIECSETNKTPITEEECFESQVEFSESAYDDPLLDNVVIPVKKCNTLKESKKAIFEDTCGEAIDENQYCSGPNISDGEYLDNLLGDCVDSVPCIENDTKLNKKEIIPNRVPVVEDICVSIDTGNLKSELDAGDNWYDEIFTIPDEEFESVKKNIEIPVVEIGDMDDDEKSIMCSDEDLHSSGIEDEEIEEEEEEEEEENIKDKTIDSNQSSNEINNTNESISSDSGVESNSLEMDLLLNDSNVTDPNCQSLSIDYEDEVANGKEAENTLESVPVEKESDVHVISDDDCKSTSSTPNISVFNIEDIDSGTELQYDDLFSPTDPHDNDSDYNTWLTSIKPLLCDCNVVANLFSRLANKYCEYKDGGKKAYYMQQVHMATTAYDVITDNNLTNFSSVISIMLSYVGAIKSEKPPPSNISVPNILVFLEQLVEKGSLSSFHITLFTVLLSRPNEKLKKYHSLRVNLLHTCFMQELRHLKIMSNNELRRQLCVTFIKISEYFVHFDEKLASRLVDDHILSKLTPRNDVEFIDSVLGYMGLGDNKNENILTTNDVSSSLVLLNIIYKKTQLSSISTQNLNTVLKSEDNPRFRFCDQERDSLLETMSDLGESNSKRESAL